MSLSFFHIDCDLPGGSSMAGASVLGVHNDWILSAAIFNLPLTCALTYYVVPPL